MYVYHRLFNLTLDSTAVSFFVGAELGEDEGFLVGICFCTKKTEV